MPADSTLGGVAINLLRIDNVIVYVFERPAAGQPRPDWFPAEVGDTFHLTEGTVIDHVAFSASEIQPRFDRLRRAGVTIVRPPTRIAEYGMTSFFVRGPDGLLIEIVEEAPIPEGIWRPVPIVEIDDVCCRGSDRDQSAEECTTATQVVFPYRGVYVRHLGQNQAVAEANQVLFFNAAES